jgi:hypothetical protein
VAASFCLNAASTLAQEPTPELQPPHGEFPPSFWELHGWQIILAASIFLAIVVLAILWLRRPKPVVIEPPVVIARCALEKLRSRPGKASLDLEVSRILKRYALAALQLPPEELTTVELCGILKSHPQISPELAAHLGDFLRHCDECKFSPSPSTPELGAVTGALDLVEKIELCLMRHTTPETIA